MWAGRCRPSLQTRHQPRMQKILIVEDEPAIALGLKDGLEADGYATEIVTDGISAEARARQGKYDLILLDIALPKKDGLAVCRDLRAVGIRTPIIALTARAQEIDRVLGFELGVDDYVTKPFSPRELSGRIKAVLRRAHGAPGEDDVWERADIVVNFRRFEATRGGRPIELTPMEFRLLRTFVTNPGRVLSVREIIDLAWGANTFVTDRVVYTHVNNLRAKIEVHPSAPELIVSVRRVGYRFDG
jgi:two-component system, OmpR family, alkaline phosphatase synthesis response regulator PhoP